MKVRGIRGATTVTENTASAIYDATQELMQEIVLQNDIDIDNVASVFLTMTQDLNADFPAKAVRSLPGWQWVPLMCAPELNVTGAMKRCIRVLIHTNTTKSQQDLIHVYLREATRLRPDVVERQSGTTHTPDV